MSRTSRTVAAMALGFATLLAGCDKPVAGLPAAAVEPPATTPLEPPGRRLLPLRPVPMPAGESIAFLPRETTRQVLCQAIDEDKWADLLGGDVTRQVHDTFGCEVRGGGLRVRLDTTGGLYHAGVINLSGTEERTGDLGGRRARAVVTPDGKGISAAAVALTPAAESEEVLHNYVNSIRPTLTISVTAEEYGSEHRPTHEVMVEVAEEVVPAVTPQGPTFAVPDRKANGEIPFTEMPLVRKGRIVDMPLPHQGMQLCTLARELLGEHANEAKVTVTDIGRCILGTDRWNVYTYINHFSPLEDATELISGRPAAVGPHGDARVQLRDDAPGVLHTQVSRNAPVDPWAYAEEVTSRLLAG
ncbi:hypothetical protein GCM10012275_50150 [Longimycelium tulufanense]|uniref:Uncharacterized protein n=1 Tax=Longimycelium tulufanense TaxID=907463 RepID=A0A8J3CCD1_9PSEU|nr:hypothetical protein [Longimycelium tulufanense]GGM73465.1 hypothetical protein GCM10012275_50150 [Longimycelium tulufanense]